MSINKRRIVKSRELSDLNAVDLRRLDATTRWVDRELHASRDGEYRLRESEFAR